MNRTPSPAARQVRSDEWWAKLVRLELRMFLRVYGPVEAERHLRECIPQWPPGTLRALRRIAKGGRS